MNLGMEIIYPKSSSFLNWGLDVDVLSLNFNFMESAFSDKFVFISFAFHSSVIEFNEFFTPNCQRFSDSFHEKSFDF